MKIVRKVLLYLIMGLVVALFLAAVGGWIFLKSDHLRKKVESMAARQTGTKVEVRSLSLAWNGLVLQGLNIPNPSPYTDRFLFVEEVALEVPWIKLIRGDMDLKTLTVRDSVVTIHQRPQGGFALPVAPREATPQPTTANSETKHPPDARLQMWKLKNSHFDIFDESGDQLIRVEGADAQGDLALIEGVARTQGTVRIGKVTVMSDLHFENTESGFLYEGSRLDLEPIRATAYAGTLTGTSYLDLEDESGMFRFDLSGKEIDTDLLMRSFGKPEQWMQGTLDLNFKAQGLLDHPKDLKGTGDFVIEPVHMPHLKISKVLGALLGIKLLEDGTFESIQGNFRVDNQKVTFTRLDVQSEHLVVFLKGTVGFDQQLNLSGELVLQPGVAASFEQLFGQTADQVRQDERRLPLRITGTSSDPKVSLDGVGTAIDIGRSLLERFLKPQNPEEGSEPEGELKEADLDALMKGLFGK
ncbi:MAG: AsmA-like C-terminal region-containing protein [Candidatus Methylacidiphilales bacterium]